jgi:hypothetical protein
MAVSRGKSPVRELRCRTHVQDVLPPISGYARYGYERVRLAFIDNFARRRELGGACCACCGGETVVDVWGGVRDKAIVLTFIGMVLRGPFWQIYWPWQAWPVPGSCPSLTHHAMDYHDHPFRDAGPAPPTPASPARTTRVGVASGPYRSHRPSRLRGNSARIPSTLALDTWDRTQPSSRPLQDGLFAHSPV